MGKLFSVVFLHCEDSCRSHDTFPITGVNPDHLQAVISVAGPEEATGLSAQKWRQMLQQSLW